MPVQFENYTHSFKVNGKPVFAPSARGRKIGEDLKGKIESIFRFDDFFYHLAAGGHIAAIHSHRENRYFCKADIENFFYTIPRNRVVRTLRDIGIERPEHYGKWSCVKKPEGDGGYILPYGFVQSPILASLVLSKSAVGKFLRKIRQKVNVAVYVDDITLSSDNLDELKNCYDTLTQTMADAGFRPKPAKCVPPIESLSVFNCSLKKGHTEVLDIRKDEFFQFERSNPSKESFQRYCYAVESGNT